jgi:hypothetical protein
VGDHLLRQLELLGQNLQRPNSETRNGKSFILELLSVTICYAFTSEKSSEQDPNIDSDMMVNLQNLLFFTHQNFLVLIDVIINKLPSKSSHNIWVHSLQAILLNKAARNCFMNQKDQKEASLTMQRPYFYRTMSH